MYASLTQRLNFDYHALFDNRKPHEAEEENEAPKLENEDTYYSVKKLKESIRYKFDSLRQRSLHRRQRQSDTATTLNEIYNYYLEYESDTESEKKGDKTLSYIDMFKNKVGVFRTNSQKPQSATVSESSLYNLTIPQDDCSAKLNLSDEILKENVQAESFIEKASFGERLRAGTIKTRRKVFNQ